MARRGRGVAVARRAGLGLALCVLGTTKAANVATVASVRVTPTEKVVLLLNDLYTKVEKEGDFEAQTYNDFACFCKDTMAEKSAAITTGGDTRDSLEAEIEGAMTRRKDADKGLKDATESISTLQGEITTMTAEHKEEVLASERDELDLTNAIQALEAAIREMQAAKLATSFVSIGPLRKQVGHAVAMAQVLDFPHTRGKAAAGLLQVLMDPLEVPDSVYEYHGNDIVTTLEGLEKDFKAKRIEVQEAAVEAKKVYTGLLQEKESAIEIHQKAIEESKTEKAKEKKAIATNSEDLSSVSAKLLDDQEYLEELSAQCHEKAVMWKQRSEMRARELQALSSATDMIQSLEKEAAETAPAPAPGASLAQQAAQRGPRAGASAAPLSLVQVAAHDHSRRQPERRSGLARPLALLKGGAAEQAPLAQALALLRSKAGSLKSVVLLNLTSAAAEDPLAKVKDMVAALIERLLKEAEAEANHKGWCDKEVGSAEQKRDYAAKEIEEINTFLQESEVRHEKLSEQSSDLKEEMKELTDELNKAAALRAFEEAEAKAAIESAKSSSKVVGEAMDMLEKFYAEAANQDASQLSLLQAESRSRSRGGSTPEEDMPDAGFSDVYTGDQGSSTGVLAMLEVIKSDFDRTVVETEKAEKEAAQEWLAMQTDTGKSNATKTETLKSIEAQLSETEADETAAKDSLVSQQTLLDKALGHLEALGPPCLGTGGMSPEEKKIKRDEEIEALNQALCILDQHGGGGAEMC